MAIFKRKIEFLTNGGGAIKRIRVAAGAVVDVKALPVPSRKGFIFAGWHFDTGLTKAVAVFKMPDANTVLCARWLSSKAFPAKTFMPRARFDFKLKLSLSTNKIKCYYSAVRNAFRNYGARAYTRGKREHYQNGALILGRFVFKNKSLVLCLPLKLDDCRFPPEEYNPIDMSRFAACRDLPYGFKVGSKKSVPMALALIDAVAADNKQSKKSLRPVDYVALFDDVATKTQRLGYAHILKNVVTAAEAAAIDNKWSASLTDTVSYKASTEPAKTCELSVSQLSLLFNAGDNVDLFALQQKGVGVDCNRLKVTASDVLTKPLAVTADEFDPVAATQILMVRGSVTKKVAQ